MTVKIIKKIASLLLLFSFFLTSEILFDQKLQASIISIPDSSDSAFPLSRGQFLDVLYQALKYDNYYIPLKETFADVPLSNQYYIYVETAYSQGLIEGYYDEDTGMRYFQPNQPITYLEAIKILMRYFDVQYEGERVVDMPPYKNLSPSDWYFEVVMYAYSVGLLDKKFGDSESIIDLQTSFLWEDFDFSLSHFLTYDPAFAVSAFVGHIYAGGESVDAMIREFNDNFNRLAYVFFLGDSLPEHKIEYWYSLKERIIDVLEVSAYFLPGNHDYRLFYSKDKVLQKSFFNRFPRRLTLEYNGRKLMFILLSTIPYDTVPVENSTKVQEALDDMHYQYLVNQLKNSESYDYIFILMHHNIWTEGIDFVKNIEVAEDYFNDVTTVWNTNQWNSLVAPLLIPGKIFVVTGDAGTTRHFIYKKIDYYATGMPFRTDDNYYPSYLILKFDKFGKPIFLKKIIGSDSSPELLEAVNLDLLLKK